MSAKSKSRLKSLVATWRSFPPKFYLLIAFIFFISPLSIGIGSSEPTFTAVNKTGKFLHMFINSDPVLYVAPKQSASATSSSTTFDVKVFYAPGQGDSGMVVSRTFEVAYYPPPTNSAGCHSSSEEGGDYGCDCSTTTGPASYGSEVWEITPDTMLVPEPPDTTLVPKPPDQEG